MKPWLVAARCAAGIVALVWSSQISLSQDTPKLSEEKRASLIAERDAVAKQAVAKANQGDFDGAQNLFDQVFKIETSIFGEAHGELLGTLNYQAQIAEFAMDWNGVIEYRRRAYELGRSLYPQGAYQLRDLELAFEEARSNAERTDEQRRLLAQSKAANRQVVAFYKQGKNAEALVLARQILADFEKVLGKEHPNYAISLLNVAAQYRSTGDYARAEPLYLEAKTVLEKVLGKEHPSYCDSLSSQGDLYYKMGDYARAESLYSEAKTIFKKVLGKEHPSYIVNLNNLAALYVSMGDYARAEPLHLECKTIRANVYGKEHPEFAGSLNNLAGLYASIGDYARAEPLYVEAKTIHEKVLGKEHPSYAASLYNLAWLYESMGDYKRAEPLYVAAKSIYEKAYGKEHPVYATSLNNLAVLYNRMGDHTRAVRLMIECETIRENALGKEHPDYAFSLSKLALLYKSMGDYARAEPLLSEALAIIEKALGKNHRQYAASLNNLAVLYNDMGDHARAVRLMIEGKTIRENALGKEHPDYALSLNNLAAVYDLMGDHVRAEPLFRQAIEITLKHVEETSYAQSEQQQMLMGQSVRHRLDNYLMCCIGGELNADSAIEQLILWKGSILRRGRGLRLVANDRAVSELFQELQSVASQLSAVIRGIPSPEKLDAWKQRTASLTEKKRQLEVELNRRSAAFRDAVKPISFASIRESIPTDGVLIDYLEYSGKEGRSLAASIIHREGELVLINLGSAEKAGEAIDRWRESFGMTAEAQAAGVELRRQLWEPLLEHVTGAELILVSTDGVLGRLPLAALPGEKQGTYLIEDHRLALIPVPQLLPALVREQGAQSSGYDTLLVGDVDYGVSDAENAWPKLAETGREVDFISEIVTQSTHADPSSVNKLRAAAATESAFRELAPKCQLLHLATHGFFAPAEKKNALSASVIAKSRGVEMMQLSSEFESHRDMVAGFSPGQLSGLVFAGANHTSEQISKFSSGKPIDDGIMTADEIAFLPLEKTELAVLSACETGLGEVAGGEGLIGIQRAFQVAGADSVVATMWKVDDVMTRKLMERFYQNLFAKKMPKLDALRDAQLWVLRNPALVTQSDDRGAVREKKKPIESTGTHSDPRTNPYFWAPFVLSGDWR